MKEEQHGPNTEMLGHVGRQNLDFLKVEEQLGSFALEHGREY